jgi:hypothetical protein
LVRKLIIGYNKPMSAQEEKKKKTKVEPSQEEIQKEFERTLKRVKEKTFLSWKAPARPFKTRNREFYVTLFAIAGLVGLVLFIAEGLMPVILIISVVFLFYVMSTVSPQDVEYKVTNFGIKVGDRGTLWDAMRRFWFTHRFNSELLVVETSILPGRLELVVKPEIKKELRELMQKYLPEEKTPASFLDKSASWLSKKMPGN